LWLLALAAAVAWPATPQGADEQRIDRVLAQTPLIDGHNDLPWEIRQRFGGDLTKVDLSANTAALAAPSGDCHWRPTFHGCAAGMSARSSGRCTSRWR